jgi:hypothetical protein
MASPLILESISEVSSFMGEKEQQIFESLTA